MKPLNGISAKNGDEGRSFFSPLDKITIFYILFSTVYLCLGVNYLPNSLPHFIARITILALIFGLAYLDKKYPNETLSAIRNLYPFFLLNYFYPETSYLNNILIENDFDGFVSNYEQSVFGCQPSIEFCKNFPNEWFNELMNICYFSYYFFVVFVCVVLLVKNRRQSYRGIFMVMFSFYLYYIIFCFIPVVGPQFYFSPVDATVPSPYFFGKLMHYFQVKIEQPTGALPSSHVGIIFILAYLSYKHLRKLFYIILPFAIGICLATVYIKAHYAVDVIAGLISVPIFIVLSNAAYNKLVGRAFKRKQKI